MIIGALGGSMLNGMDFFFLKKKITSATGKKSKRSDDSSLGGNIASAELQRADPQADDVFADLCYLGG